LKKKFFQVKLRKILTQETPTSELIYFVRHSFIETRSTINRLDESLSLINLLNVMFEMLTVLTQIYILIIYGNLDVIRKLAVTLLLSCLANAVKLIGDCLINGLVHDEADVLLSCLDDIPISKLSESDLKEVKIFMSMNRNLKFGFSIAGLMLFRKTALTSLRKLFLINFFIP
jgi:hypothetical protein